jgi:hypothetical protein
MNKLFLTLGTLVVMTQLGFSTGVQQQELPTEQLKKQNKELVKLAATEINKTLPQTIDTYTTLTKVEGKETTILYTYEINTGSKSDETVQKEDKSRMKEAVTYGICKGSKRFLDAQINISYLYISAKSKVELFRFDVSQSDCMNIKRD